MGLREDTIKLASDHPELRQHLVPLLRKQAKSWTPEQRVVTLLLDLGKAQSHLYYLGREAPWAKKVLDQAHRLVEQASQVVDRDLTREMSLPSIQS